MSGSMTVMYLCVRDIASVYDFRLDRWIFDSGRDFEFDYYKIFKLQYVDFLKINYFHS